MLHWLREHVDPEQWDSVEADLFSPLPGRRRDPDQVTTAVVEEEMSLFQSFARQNRELGG